MMKIFKEIDNLVNLDIGNRGVRNLHRAATDDTPLCLESARILDKQLKKESHICITTGFPIGNQKIPETDGPLGAAMLGKTVKNLGAEPVFLVEKFCKGPMEKLLDLNDLDNAKMETLHTKKNRTEQFCDKILNEYDPSLLISIEKPGKAADCSYHDMKGNDISDKVGEIDELFDRASDSGIPTIGIGDGGNEIGMGNVHTAVEEYVPKGEKIASATKVDSLVTAGVSNWGGYGILASLSRIRNKQLVHDRELEKEMIKTFVDSGGIDGVKKESEYSVDGVYCDFHSHMVEMLRYLASR